MKKMLCLILVCITVVSSMAFAEPIVEEVSYTVAPIPVEHRSYTGFKIKYGKEIKEGKITMYVYHTKMNNREVFWFFVEHCTYEGMVGGCGVFSSGGWVEGKVSGQNWIIRDESFNAFLGKNIGHIRTNYMFATLKIE